MQGSEQVISQITEILVQTARPAKIILFGSRARNDSGDDSDFDLLVVEEDLQNRHAEMVRLNRALRRVGAPVDLLVVDRKKYEYWRDTPGNVYHTADSEGRVLYEAA